MIKEEFGKALETLSDQISRIMERAHQVHRHVNQHYAGVHEYGFHLDMVAGFAKEYGFEVCQGEDEILPLLFGAYFHDSIEDARLTYSDLRAIAGEYMDEASALAATEIAYALTNDKGRTRAERAGEKYYSGIRQCPYAPFVKMCDRLANTSFSASGAEGGNPRMLGVYSKEYPHFIESITVETDDPRFIVPDSMRQRMMELLGQAC